MPSRVAQDERKFNQPYNILRPRNKLVHFIKKSSKGEKRKKTISKQSTLQRVISRSTLSKENNDTIARAFTPHT